MGYMRKNLKKDWKKSFGFGKKNFGSDTDTETGPWFRFPIPKPGFGRTLLLNMIETKYLVSEKGGCMWVGLKSTDKKLGQPLKPFTTSVLNGLEDYTWLHPKLWTLS